MKKEYTNGEITVVWQSEKCIHCGNCAKGLPEVFKPREKPWIQMENASSEAIAAQVNKCPSGALSLKD
ncbi:MAG: (4Fe-4S)-binding protein [Flavobacteriales bacterium]|nr:(4Fe-4S)-binding protein [Flavobacteriales bacterium]